MNTIIVTAMLIAGNPALPSKEPIQATIREEQFAEPPKELLFNDDFGFYLEK